MCGGVNGGMSLVMLAVSSTAPGTTHPAYATHIRMIAPIDSSSRNGAAAGIWLRLGQISGRAIIRQGPFDVAAACAEADLG